MGGWDGNKKDAHAIWDVHIDIHVHLRLLGNTGQNQNVQMSCMWKKNNEMARGDEFESELTMINSEIRL